MPIRNAIFLLNAIDNDQRLRDLLYRCKNYEELMECLKTLGIPFTREEFEDAVNHLHVQCQTFENAQLLMQKAEWARYIMFINQREAS